MLSGSTLLSGEFIGNNDGSVYLIMQADGNIGLYTSKFETNCKALTNPDGLMGSGSGGHAIYDIGMTGYPKNI
jgi:hypothetical protein